jgi:hypothetical protein
LKAIREKQNDGKNLIKFIFFRLQRVFLAAFLYLCCSPHRQNHPSILLSCTLKDALSHSHKNIIFLRVELRFFFHKRVAGDENEGESERVRRTTATYIYKIILVVP